MVIEVIMPGGTIYGSVSHLIRDNEPSHDPYKTYIRFEIWTAWQQKEFRVPIIPLLESILTVF